MSHRRRPVRRISFQDYVAFCVVLALKHLERLCSSSTGRLHAGDDYPCVGGDWIDLPMHVCTYSKYMYLGRYRGDTHDSGQMLAVFRFRIERGVH